MIVYSQRMFGAYPPGQPGDPKDCTSLVAGKVPPHVMGTEISTLDFINVQTRSGVAFSKVPLVSSTPGNFTIFCIIFGNPINGQKSHKNPKNL